MRSNVREMSSPKQWTFLGDDIFRALERIESKQPWFVNNPTKLETFKLINMSLRDYPISHWSELLLYCPMQLIFKEIYVERDSNFSLKWPSFLKKWYVRFTLTPFNHISDQYNVEDSVVSSLKSNCLHIFLKHKCVRHSTETPVLKISWLRISWSDKAVNGTDVNRTCHFLQTESHLKLRVQSLKYDNTGSYRRRYWIEGDIE